MDFGRLLLSYFLFCENDFYNRYEKELSQYYVQLIDNISYDHFRILAIYFFIVFYYGQYSEQAHYDKINPFIYDFRSLLNSYQDEQDTMKY